MDTPTAPLFADQVNCPIPAGTAVRRHFDNGVKRACRVVEDKGGATIRLSNNASGTGRQQDVARSSVQLPEGFTPPAQPKATTARAPLPDGHVTIAGLAREINTRGLYHGTSTTGQLETGTLATQIRHAEGRYPFPWVPGLGVKACKLDEGLAWWEAKNARVQRRKDRKAG